MVLAVVVVKTTIGTIGDGYSSTILDAAPDAAIADHHGEVTDHRAGFGELHPALHFPPFRFGLPEVGDPREAEKPGGRR